MNSLMDISGEKVVYIGHTETTKTAFNGSEDSRGIFG